MSKTFEITEEEYQEKRFEVAKHLLPSLVDKQTEAFLIDKRKRGSLLFNCVAISTHLLEELGYTRKGVSRESEMDRTAIRNLGEIFRKTRK